MFEKFKNMLRPSRDAQPYDTAELARELTQNSIDEMYHNSKETLESNIRYAVKCGQFETSHYVSNKNHHELLKKEFESRGFKVILWGNEMTLQWN